LGLKVGAMRITWQVYFGLGTTSALAVKLPLMACARSVNATVVAVLRWAGEVVVCQPPVGTSGHLSEWVGPALLHSQLVFLPVTGAPSA
jgi:hypothetical protein